MTAEEFKQESERLRKEHNYDEDEGKVYVLFGQPGPRKAAEEDLSKKPER